MRKSERAFRFYGVPDGVAEVEQAARSVLVLVLFHHAALAVHAEVHEPFQIGVVDALRHQVENFTAFQHGVLHRFSESAFPFGFGEGRECVEVANHRTGDIFCPRGSCPL